MSSPPAAVVLSSLPLVRLPEAGPLPLPKVVLCDLDGTLIDSMPTLADLATEVIEERYGTPRVLARELYVATCGLPFVKQLEHIYPGDPRNAEAAAAFEARKPARCNAIRMPADTRRALERLRGMGVRIGVSSNNGTENVLAFARNADFTFDLLLGYGGGLAKGKPHLDATARVFGTARQEMLFVGDSLHDGEIAEREGIPFVGVATTFSPERFALRFPHVPVVRRFSALPDLFRVDLAGLRPAESVAGG
jgi:phosphoglycolate phosphatase-like HAD superfamily hydrolase